MGNSSNDRPPAVRSASTSTRRRSPLSTSLTVVLLIGILLFFVLAMVGFAVDNASSANSTAVFYVFPLLLVGGVVVFMLAAAAIVTVFDRANLTDDTQPFGLPEGTVRAFIATAFIFAFFMLAFFLYYDMAVNHRTGPAADLAKQLTTTLSTLVVAIAAFYFGASTVQRTKEGPKRSEPDQPTDTDGDE